MTIQPIDAVLSETDIAEIMAALEIVSQKLPFLVGLSVEDRRKLPKLGRKSQTFVMQALDMAQNHEELMPRFLNVEAARRDVDLFEALNPVLQTLRRLQELVEDTQMVVGSEAYATARLAYNSAKTSGKNMGLDQVVSELSRQFARKPRKEQGTETASV